MANKTYYDLLGVPRTATIDEIKRAYIRIAKASHPDRPPETEIAEIAELSQNETDLSRTRAFKILTFAYHTLTDEKLRAEYDRFMPPQVKEWNDVAPDRFADKLGSYAAANQERKFGMAPLEQDEDTTPIPAAKKHSLLQTISELLFKVMG